MENFDCPYFKNNICSYKKRFSLDEEEISTCTAGDKGDYEMSKSDCWFPEKLTRSLESTCPLINLLWIKQTSFSIKNKE